MLLWSISMSCEANLYIFVGAGIIFTLLFELICVVIYEDCTLACSLKEVTMFQACRNPKGSFDQLWFDVGGFCLSDHSKVNLMSITVMPVRSQFVCSGISILYTAELFSFHRFGLKLLVVTLYDRWIYDEYCYWLAVLHLFTLDFFTPVATHGHSTSNGKSAVCTDIICTVLQALIKRQHH